MERCLMQVFVTPNLPTIGKNIGKECCKCFLLGWAVNALHNSCNVLINEFNFPFGIYRLKTLIISVCVTIRRKLFGRMCRRLSHQWEKHPAVAEDPVTSDAAKQIPTGQ